MHILLLSRLIVNYYYYHTSISLIRPKTAPRLVISSPPPPAGQVPPAVRQGPARTILTRETAERPPSPALRHPRQSRANHAPIAARLLPRPGPRPICNCGESRTREPEQSGEPGGSPSIGIPKMGKRVDVSIYKDAFFSLFGTLVLFSTLFFTFILDSGLAVGARSMCK